MKIALRPLIIASAALVLAGLSACKSTTLESAWKAPEVGSIKFTKVLVIGIAPVDSMRRPLEDAMKAQVPAVPTVASYELLPKVEDQADPMKVGEIVKTSGVDGIITMKMISLDDEVTYHPGSTMPVAYESFYGYYSRPYGLSPFYAGRPVGAYGMGMPVAYEYTPPSVTTTPIMSIETNIYNAKDGKLVWTGLTRTKNPDESKNLVADVAALVRAKLREQKLIP